MATRAKKADAPGVSAFALALQQMPQDGGGPVITSFDMADLTVEIRAAADSVWAFIRREGGGGLALRAASLVGDFNCILKRPKKRGDRAAACCQPSRRA